MNDNDFFEQNENSQESAPTLKIKSSASDLTIKSPASTDAPVLKIKSPVQEHSSSPLTIKSPPPLEEPPSLKIKQPNPKEDTPSLSEEEPDNFYNTFEDQNEDPSKSDFQDEFYGDAEETSQNIDDFFSDTEEPPLVNSEPTPVHVNDNQPELFDFSDASNTENIKTLNTELSLDLDSQYESQNDVDSFLPNDDQDIKETTPAQESVQEEANSGSNIIDPPNHEEPIIKAKSITPSSADDEGINQSWRQKTLRSPEEMPPPSNSESMKKLKEMDIDAGDHSPKTILLLDRPLPEDGDLDSLSKLDQAKNLETPKKPSNTGAMKIIQEDPQTPSPGEHAPQTIIVLNKPLPSEVKADEHISDVDLHEEVLNTAAQENVFEHLGETEPQFQSQHLFNADSIPEEKPTHLLNSPTLYEMEDDMTLGQALLHARENASLTIKELSRKTNIKEMHIISLEDENRSKLPDPIYTKSYIKTLCNELNLPYEKVVDLYAQLMGAEYDTQYNIAQKSPDKFASKPASSAIQKWSAIIAIFVIISLTAAGFAIQNFYTPVPVLQDGDIIDLNEFHPSVTVPIPRLEIPKN